MKTRLLWALLSWLSLLSFGAQAQTTLASEGFEGASTDYGYTASPTIMGVNYQYFERQAFQTPDATSSLYRDSESPLSTGSSATIRSMYGANIWTAEGVRGFIGNSSNRSAKVVQLRAIPTTGYRNLRMVVAFASARGAGYVGGGANDVATTDRIRLQYSFNDGATWTTAGLLLGNNGTTGNFQQDTSSPLDSIPNGDVMSPTLRDYTANISGTGTSLLVRVVADTRQPSFAFDNIRVLGDVDNTPKPTLNIPETTPASYTEGGSPVQLSGGLTVGYSDNSATNITGGTVNISAGFGGSTERLNFVNQLGITGSYNTGNGTLTLSGTNTQANYQMALRSITYSSTNATTLPSGTRQITFQLSAGGVVSNSPVRIVNVTQALNNPAALTTTYTEPFDTDGEGQRYASDMFFNASGPVGFFRSTTNPPSSGGTALSSTTYGGTSGGFWYGEGTTSALNPKNPFSSLQLAPVNASGYNKVRFTLALGASGSWAPYQNTDNVGDWFELFYSTDGGTTLTKFGAFYGTNQLPRVGPLQDDDLNPVTPTTPSANLKRLSSTLQDIQFELPSAAFVSNLTIVLRQRASINAEIAFDNIRITGVVPPTVTTAAATSLTTTSAVLGGSVTADGGDAVTARGVVYSTTNQTPAIGGTSVRQDANGTGTGSFSETIAGLAPGTLYYVRAYASNSVGTSYGAVQTFTTLTVPTVTTDAATSITTTSAVLGGSVTADGGTSVTERGVVYSTTNATPTTNDTKAANGTGTGAFSATITGLASRTTYNVRAYATNSVGTSYGVVQPFTTLNNPPVVTTTGGTTTYIIGGGAVTIDNGLTVTDADNPTLASAKVTITSGLQSGQDVLMFTNTNTTTFGNIASTQSVNGTLNLTSSGATATVTQWQAALRAVTFDNMNGTAPTTVRTVSFVVNDGTTDSAPATRTITFAPATTVVSVTRLTPSPTATAQVRYQVVFSRSVSGLTVSNFNTTTTGSVTVNGTGVSSAVGSGTTYTVTVNTGTGDGTLRLNVANNAGITPTVSGLPYTAGETYTITKSFAANPQLTIQGAGSTGRDVTAFVDAVQVLSGGTAVANALRNGSFETHNPLANGDFGYQPTGADWTFNAQAGIAESGSAFTPTTPIPKGIAVAFLQSLVDINNQRQNGQLQQNLAVPTGSYQVNFQAAQRVCCTTLDQSLNVFLSGVFIGTIQPGSDNYTAFTSATFSVSAPALTASISSTAGASGSTTATSPIPFAVTFSQNVTGFTASDVTITGGTLTGFSGSGATYTFNITPSASGTIMVNVPANSAFDGNNTGNLAAEQYTLSYSQPVTAAPVVTAPANGTFVNITNPTYSGTAPASSTVTVYVDGSSVGTTTATTSGTFVLTQPTALAQGSHTVRGTAQASGSAVSANSNTNTFTVDQTAPTVAITSTAGTNGSTTTTTPIPYTVTFSEAVTGFVQGDVSVGNGTIAGFSGSGTTYTFNVTPTTAGTATTVNVPANVAVDRADNGNSAAIQLSITYQQLVTAAPVVTTPANGSMLNTAMPTYIGTAPANSTVTVYVDNTAIGTTTAPGGTFSLMQPASLADGSHTVRATAQLSGNTVSTSSNTNTFIVDATAPTVVLGSTATNPTSTSPIPVTVTFSESVTGFVGGDVTVSNGTLGNFSGSGSLYTFSVTPVSNGTVTVDISANVAQDAASNGNTAATQFTITYAAPITVTTWTGNVSTDWFTAGNWTAGIPNAAVDAIIPTNERNYPVLAANAATKNLSLNSGATLTQTTGTLDIRGNLTNNGTFAVNGGTMALGTSTLANILGSSNTRFWNLAIGANGAQLSTSASTLVQRVMTLDGGFATNGNPLTLESNNVGTAMLVNNGSSVVSGNVTVQRYISPVLNPNLGYRHFSSPIRTGTVASLATNAFSPVVNPAYNTLAVPGQARPFPTVFGYDQSRIATVTNSLPSFDKGWFSPSALSDALTVGQGYAVNLPANQTITQTGPQNNGNIVLNLSRNAGPTAAESGLALVGNPYPSPLNWQQVDATDRPGLDGVIYTFISNDPTNPYAGSYGFYNNGFGTILPVLPLGQGFFVRVSQGQTGATLTLKNSHRATAYDSPTYQRTAETRPVVHLTLKGTGNALSDDAFVYFEQGSSEGFDPQYDAVKIPNTNGLNLSTSVTGQQFSIDGRPELGSVQRVVPLAVGVPTPGSYALASAELLNLAATPVYLRDLQLGTLTDLRLTPNYQFTVTNSSALITSRFELVFSPQQALATVPAALAQQVALYPNPAKKAAFVELPTSLGRQAVTATLVDALGRQVRTVQLPAQGSVAHPLDLSDLATGVYALRLSTSAGVVVKKLVIE